MKLIYKTVITEVVPIDLVHKDINNSVGTEIDQSIERTMKHMQKMREEFPEKTPDKMQSITVEFEDIDLPYLNQVY
jgi:hypothetical protein